MPKDSSTQARVDNSCFLRLRRSADAAHGVGGQGIGCLGQNQDHRATGAGWARFFALKLKILFFLMCCSFSFSFVFARGPLRCLRTEFSRRLLIYLL